MEPASVRISIDYYYGPEETDAVHVGQAPDGDGELFRIARPSLYFAGVAREDVVWLKSLGGDRYLFHKVVERSEWETKALLLPNGTSASPEAFDAFKRTIAGASYILEGERLGDDGPGVVVSVPPGVPGDALTRAYERLFERTAGLSLADFEARAAEAARQREAERREQQAREQRASRRRRMRSAIVQGALKALIVAAALAPIGYWIIAFVTATALTRPRIAALGMIVAILPTVIASLGDSQFRSFMLGAVATGVAAYILAGSITQPDSATVAVALGLIYAFVIGGVALLYGLFSGFAASERDLKLTWLLLVLPCLSSAITAVLYAVTVSRAGGIGFEARMVSRIAGVVFSIPLVLSPLRRRTLRSMRSVVVPLALVWSVVWLFGGLG